MTVLPRSAGTFLIGRSRISLRPSAVSRIVWMSGALEGLDPQEVPMREAHRRPPPRGCADAGFAFARGGRRTARRRRGAPRFWMSTTSSFPSSSRTCTWTASSREVESERPDVVGADGQLAVPAVHEHGELDARRAAEVDELVEGGADGAPGEEHVVHEHHGAPVDREEDVGALGDGLGGEAREVVPVERDVEGAHRGLAPPPPRR